MDYSQKLALSYYKTIATINEKHKIFLVQHQETHKIYIKKILSIYNIDIYITLFSNPVLGIPRIIEYYESDNQLTIIEDYVSGCSLQDIISDNDNDLETIIGYVKQLCRILNKLHNMQPPIVHRDIKPSNIIITEYGNVVLIDFNAAKYYSDDSVNDTVLLGTKGYAAPEQYGFGSSSPKTDIYAVGILLKELTSSLPKVPDSLRRIIDKCIKISPDERFNSIEELMNALNNLSSSSGYTESQKISLNQLLPPGFRTHTVWKMFVSVPCYLFILWLCLSLKIENTFGIELWIERIFCLLMFLSIIAGTCNYMDIHRYFPLCKSNRLIVKIIGIILLDTILVVSLFIIMVIIISLMFSGTKS